MASRRWLPAEKHTRIKKAGKLAGPVHDGFHAMLKMFDPTNRFLEENDAFATRASYEREK